MNVPTYKWPQLSCTDVIDEDYYERTELRTIHFPTSLFLPFKFLFQLLKKYSFLMASKHCLATRFAVVEFM